MSFRILALLVVSGSVAACGGAGGSTYSSLDDTGLAFEFKSGGVVTMTAKALNVSSSGTYKEDGDKLIVTIDGQQHTFIRDGKCIEEGRGIFGKLCEGGKAGAASNVSTRKPPPTEGTWSGKNADGEFAIEFKPADKLTFTGTQAGSGKVDSEEGSFVVSGDRVDVRLASGMPVVLQFVNGAYETTSLGMPLTLQRK
jgi:hypothetical protein